MAGCSFLEIFCIGLHFTTTWLSTWQGFEYELIVQVSLDCLVQIFQLYAARFVSKHFIYSEGEDALRMTVDVRNENDALLVSWSAHLRLKKCIFCSGRNVLSHSLVLRKMLP